MSRRMKWIILCVCFAAFCLFAQEGKSKIESYLEDFSGQVESNLQNYMQPFVNSFGANLNNGLYHTARIPKRGFHLYVGMETMVAFISEDQTIYTAVFNDPTGLNPPSEETGVSTIFGGKGGKQVTVFGQTYNLPGGFDIRAFPIIAPRITVGCLMGTELSFRIVEVDIPNNFGLLKISGFGLRHSFSQYFPLAPIDICFGFFVQDFELGRVFQANMTFFGVQASRSLGPLTVYGGLGIEKTSMLIGNADGLLNIQPMSFDSDNRGRANVGIAINLLVLNLHADYTLGHQNVATIGIGIGL